MNNFCSAEIKRFDKLSDKWWCKDGAFRFLHLFNPVRLNFLSRCAGKAKKLELLDVGCGGGIFSECLHKAGHTVTGIDISQRSLKVAKTHARTAGLGINYHYSTVEDFSSSYAGKFDSVVCMEVLEHVPDMSSVIKSCANLVKAGGTVIYSTINRNLKSFMFAIVMAEYLFGLLPTGTHTYHKFITPYELISEAEKYSLVPLDITGVSYNIVTNNLSITPSVDVNYMIAFTKLL